MQPLLSSSYQGWGVSSLDTDADEIHLLAKHLRAECESQVLASVLVLSILSPDARQAQWAWVFKVFYSQMTWDI